MTERTGFWWGDRDCSTYGDLGSTLCTIKTAEEAQSLWDAYVAWLSRPDAKLCGKGPEEVAASNIGYLMGYYGDEERKRVYALFPTASHPVFGYDFGR